MRQSIIILGWRKLFLDSFSSFNLNYVLAYSQIYYYLHTLIKLKQVRFDLSFAVFRASRQYFNNYFYAFGPPDGASIIIFMLSGGPTVLQ